MLSDEHKPLVRNHWLFQRLDQVHLDDVLRRLFVKHFRQDEQIFLQGDDGDCLYIIVSGYARIYLAALDGRESELRVFGPGDLFGEFALIDEGARSASAQAQTAMEVLVLTRNDMWALLRENFELTRHLLKLLVQRLRYTTAHAERIVFWDAQARLIDFLLRYPRYGDANRDQQTIYASQNAIARALTVTREWVSKSLKGLVERGLVRIERGGITVLSVKALQAYFDALVN